MKLVKITLLIVASLVLLLAANSQSGVKTCHEYSNLVDEAAAAGGGAHGGPMPGMILYTDPPDPAGAPNPFSVRQLNTTGQVDGIANYGDAYFPQVVANRADLYVSFLGDEGVAERAVFYETPAGVRGLQWTQTNFCNPNTGDLEDLDGLEVWGPYSGSDVNRYSITNDWATGGTSLYNYVSGGPDTPYISQATVVAWVTNASLAPEQYTGSANDVDIDGVMIRDYGIRGQFDDQDEILFSIRAAGNWDGGEIVYVKNGQAPRFLNHGGHLWNTSFNLQVAFGVSTEEVDAIEAVDETSGGYSMVMRWPVYWLCDVPFVPGSPVTLTASTPATVSLAKGTTVEEVTLTSATITVDVGPDIGGVSSIIVTGGSGDFDGYVFGGVAIPPSSFTIAGGSGTIDWTLDNNIKVTSTIVVSAGGFGDINATAFGSGYLTTPTDVVLEFGEAIEIGDIPTITEWGFIAIMLLLLIGGAFAIVRRRRSVNARA